MYEMEWNGLDWIGKYMIHCGSCLPIYLVKGYLSSWNGWMNGRMDLMEPETNNRRNDF